MINFYKFYNKTGLNNEHYGPLLEYIPNLPYVPYEIKMDGSDVALHTQTSQIEHIIKRDATLACLYATWMGKRWLEVEPLIMEWGGVANNYARDVLKCRWADVGKPEAEEHIMKEAYWAYIYSVDVVKERWVEAEPYIMKNGYWAFAYANAVIKGRWPEAEPIILNDTPESYYYAARIIRGRWEPAEPNIMQYPYYAVQYAIEIIGGRWLEAEPYIKKDAFSWEMYRDKFKI